MLVNVDKGYLPHFVSEFLKTYGAESVFVFAASDLLTSASAEAMRAHNKLVSEDTIAYFGTEEAEETLRSLVIAVDGSITLLQESCGFAPIGSFSELVDSTFEEGCFFLWLQEFESKRFNDASRIIGRSE